MRGIKPSLLLPACLLVGLAAWGSTLYEQTGSQMATAARRVLTSLDREQIDKATFAFDSPERLNWHFIPRERKGLSIKAMNSAQRALTFGLLHTGLGASGYLKATTIMSLEQVLKDIEKGSGAVRDPELYFLTLFGKPSDRGDWGWRIEGHHLSLNFTLKDGKVVSATPTFFGANPAEVRVGTREGLRALSEVEDRALRLIQALTDEQKKVAVISETAPKEIRSANAPQPPTEEAVGLAYKDMTVDQRAMLQALVESYVDDLPADVGKAWAAEIHQAGPDNVRFGWWGALDRTQAHHYRIQGPTFLVEFNNTQNNANHVHAVWRNMLGDFGMPLAAK